MDIRGDFVKTGKYFYRSNQWQLITWETALPSRIELSLPEDIVDSVNTARLTHHRFGQYSSVLETIRQEIQLTPLEKTELARLCTDHGIPSDFDVAQITWRPDYAPYYYDQLLQRARRLYLFRDQYIFLLDSAVVIETPQCGHATYVFSRPENIDLFLRCYVKTTKEAIRKNQENVAEQLGFQGRIVHGTNRKQWLFELCCRIGH